MSISIVIVDHDGKEQPHRLDVGGIGHESTGYKRMVGAAATNPKGEPEAQQIVRILGAGIFERLTQEIPEGERSERSRLANLAKTDLEKAVMLAVKALYAPAN